MKALRDNSLTIVLMIATAVTLAGMSVTGLSVYNDDLAQHHQPALSLAAYLASGHFLSALFENWNRSRLQRRIPGPGDRPHRWFPTSRR